MKQWKYWLLCLLALTARWAMASDSTTQQAGQQVFLAERLVKAYALQRLNVTASRPAEQLRASSEQFARNLQTLQQQAPTAAIREQYQLLAQLWTDYKPQLNAQADVRKLAALNEEWIYVAQQANQLWEKWDVSQGRKTERQLQQQISIQSQRLAKLYALQQLGANQPFVASDLVTAHRLVTANLRQLRQQSTQQPDRLSRIQLAETQWAFFEQALERAMKQGSSPELWRDVATTSERIVEVMDSL
ncbi:hypothetical protein [Leeia sp.]|uniref:hypothetical protein n=1 Tax=Leeia sp. TaxID=2884678 RepID=UPI0035B357D4